MCMAEKMKILIGDDDDRICDLFQGGWKDQVSMYMRQRMVRKVLRSSRPILSIY